MKIDYDQKTIALPDFLLVGATRSGTSSLSRYFQFHPGIFVPNRKEPFFFTFKDGENMPTNGFFRGDQPVTGLHEYAGLFQDATPNQIIGEGSTSYLFQPQESIRNIQETYDQAHKKVVILAILRNPVERAISMYEYLTRKNMENLPIEEAISEKVIQQRMKNGWSPLYDYLSCGLYNEQIRLYMEHFDKVHVLIYDDMKNNAPDFLREVCACLSVDEFGISTGILQTNSSQSVEPHFIKAMNRSRAKRLVTISLKRVMTANQAYKAKHFQNKIFSNIPSLSKRYTKRNRSIEIELAEYYEKSVKELGGLISRDLTHWISEYK